MEILGLHSDGVIGLLVNLRVTMLLNITDAAMLSLDYVLFL